MFFYCTCNRCALFNFVSQEHVLQREGFAYELRQLPVRNVQLEPKDVTQPPSAGERKPSSRSSETRVSWTNAKRGVPRFSSPTVRIRANPSPSLRQLISAGRSAALTIVARCMSPAPAERAFDTISGATACVTLETAENQLRVTLVPPLSRPVAPCYASTLSQRGRNTSMPCRVRSRFQHSPDY